MLTNDKSSIVEQWLHQHFGNKPGDRVPTWKASLGLFLNRGGGVVVETGCQRGDEDWGAGCSTLILAKFLKEFTAGRLFTADISPQNIELARVVARQNNVDDVVSFHVGDSVEFIEQFRQPISFLYLDSWDWSPDEPALTLCQGHQLREIMAGADRLTPDAIVLLDDNNLPNGGKTRLAKEFLSLKGWSCLLDFQQSLWVRSSDR